MKRLKLSLGALVLAMIAACGGKRDKTAPAPVIIDNPEGVPLAVPAALIADFELGKLWVLSSTPQASGPTSHRVALTLRNVSSVKQCIVDVDFKPFGETLDSLLKQGARIQAPSLTDGAKPYTDCLLPGGTAYVLTRIETSAAELKGLELIKLGVDDSRRDWVMVPIKQVELVAQTINEQGLVVELRNSSNGRLKTAGLSTWILKSGERIKDWGELKYDFNTNIADGESFRLFDQAFRSPLTADEKIELLLTDFSWQG